MVAERKGSRMFVGLAAAAIASSAVPTLADILRLTPAAAGERVLAGRAHAPIVAVVEPPQRGPAPPGEIALQLVEAAAAQDGGCTRQRWSARFGHGADTGREAARLAGVHTSTEIALSRGGACPDAPYVRLNPGAAPDAGFAALGQLERIRFRQARVRLTCTDSTVSGLCEVGGTVRELAALTPWAISCAGAEMVIWLGTPGQTVTEVRLNAAMPDRAVVSRRVPAPF